MLALLQTYKRANVAVAPELTTSDAIRTRFTREKLVGLMRTKQLQLSSAVRDRLTPKPKNQVCTTAVLDALENAGYPLNEMRQAVADGTIVEFVQKAALRWHVESTHAYNMFLKPDRPTKTENIIFQAGHLPFGLAIVAAIITEVTCAKVDFVQVAHMLWRQCVTSALGPHRDEIYDEHDYAQFRCIVFVFMSSIIDKLLKPTLEAYTTLRGRTLRRFVYNHWSLHTDVDRAMQRFMAKLCASLITKAHQRNFAFLES